MSMYHTTDVTISQTSELICPAVHLSKMR